MQANAVESLTEIFGEVGGPGQERPISGGRAAKSSQTEQFRQVMISECNQKAALVVYLRHSRGLPSRLRRACLALCDLDSPPTESRRRRIAARACCTVRGRPAQARFAFCLRDLSLNRRYRHRFRTLAPSPTPRPEALARRAPQFPMTRSAPPLFVAVQPLPMPALRDWQT